jgi:Bacterial lectin/Secretion system C-terminal sorting domain
MKKFYAIFFMSLLCTASVFSQTLQGNASVLPSSLPGSTDYQLTPAAEFQRGAYWNNVAINLANNFTVSAELNFGNQTGPASTPGFSTGADGIAFVLQSTGTAALGDVGEGLGYGGIMNSFAVEMDTWQNPNRFDPAEDHLAFMKNGDVTHNTAANSNADRYLLATDLEDGLWHPFTVSWNAATNTLTTTLDGIVRSFNGNITAFAGTNPVTWGFTSATGAALNQHRIRFLAPVCPVFTVSATVPALGCSNGNTIYLGYGPQSITAVSTPADPATTYVWYKVGTPDMQVATGATFTPTMAGTYYVIASRGTCTATTMGNAAMVTTVIDIRCGTDKVYLCHKKNGDNGNGTIGDNAHTICVSVNAVAAHLAHGCCLGACETTTERVAVSVNNDNIVYPNPTQGVVRVKVDLVQSPNAEILIMNSRGYIVERRNAAGSSAQSFDLRKYGTGIFVIKIVSGTNIITNKVMVQ